MDFIVSLTCRIYDMQLGSPSPGLPAARFYFEGYGEFRWGLECDTSTTRFMPQFVLDCTSPGRHVSHVCWYTEKSQWYVNRFNLANILPTVTIPSTASQLDEMVELIYKAYDGQCTPMLEENDSGGTTEPR